MPLEISTYVWDTNTRPCHFCLCFHGGCVFADFNIDSSGCVYLVRISFDGYGCCGMEDTVRRMSRDDSRALMKWVNDDDVDRDEVREILYRYFEQNKDVIWQDALEEHELLKR